VFVRFPEAIAAGKVGIARIVGTLTGGFSSAALLEAGCSLVMEIGGRIAEHGAILYRNEFRFIDDASKLISSLQRGYAHPIGSQSGRHSESPAKQLMGNEPDCSMFSEWVNALSHNGDRTFAPG
jgi:hypothetical protein